MKKLTLSACLAGLMTAAPLFAQSEGRVDVDQKISFGASYYGDADVDSSGVGRAAGESETRSFDVAVGLGANHGARQAWTFDFGYHYTALDYSNATNYTPSNDLSQIEAQLKWEFLPAEGDKVGYMVLVAPRFGKESGGDFLDGIHGGLGGGVTYQVNDSLSITAGAIYNHRVEEDGWIMPIVGINWQVTEQFRLYTYNGIFAEYALSEDRRHVLDASLTYESASYDLSDGNTVLRTFDPITPSSPNAPQDGSLVTREIPLEVGYTFNLNDRVGFRVAGAWIFDSTREYFVNDNEIREDDIDGTWRAGLSIIARY